MAEVILSLPLQRSGRGSKYGELFNQVSDGKAWRISRDEYAGPTKTFVLSLRGWMEHRHIPVVTRTDPEGTVFVQCEVNTS